MRLATLFRSHACECLRLADEALTLEGRTYWLGTAQVWQDIAAHLEHTHLISQRSSAVPAIDDAAGMDLADRAEGRVPSPAFLPDGETHAGVPAADLAPKSDTTC